MTRDRWRPRSTCCQGGRRLRIGACAFGALTIMLAMLSTAAGASVWQPPLDLAAGGQPDVAMDASGSALVVWSSGDSSGAGAVQGVLRERGGALMDLGDLSDGRSNSAPRAVMNQAGDAIVTWLHADANGVVVQAVVGGADGAFTAPLTLPATNGR